MFDDVAFLSPALMQHDHTRLTILIAIGSIWLLAQRFVETWAPALAKRNPWTGTIGRRQEVSGWEGGMRKLRLRTEPSSRGCTDGVSMSAIWASFRRNRCVMTETSLLTIDRALLKYDTTSVLLYRSVSPFCSCCFGVWFFFLSSASRVPRNHEPPGIHPDRQRYP